MAGRSPDSATRAAYSRRHEHRRHFASCVELLVWSRSTNRRAKPVWRSTGCSTIYSGTKGKYSEEHRMTQRNTPVESSDHFVSSQPSAKEQVDCALPSLPAGHELRSLQAGRISAQEAKRHASARADSTMRTQPRRKVHSPLLRYKRERSRRETREGFGLQAKQLSASSGQKELTNCCVRVARS